MERVESLLPTTQKKEVLAGGRNVILAVTQLPYRSSLGFSVLVKCGSRDESENLAGISHLLEHVLFKGTRKYPEAASLAFPLESIGGMDSRNNRKRIYDFYRQGSF